LIKIIIKEENFKWHLEAFASELFKYSKMDPEMEARVMAKMCVILSTIKADQIFALFKMSL